METVKIERDGAVWTVTIERPQSRNAVDGPTAKALADAFRAFRAFREPAGDCVCAVSPRLCDARTACCVHL